MRFFKVEESCSNQKSVKQMYFISPLFNQVGQLRTSSHLQLRQGQDKAKHCDKNNNTELHINKRTVNNTIDTSMQCLKMQKSMQVRQYIGHRGEIITIEH